MNSFYIKNASTYYYLNKKGGWNTGIGTYGLLSFKTKEEALAAVPANVECVIEKFVKSERKVKEDEEFVLLFRGMLFNKQDKFEFLDKKDESVVRFAKEEDAFEKAMSLDLNMNEVFVDTVKKVKEKKKD